jgi:hypothetical protein
VQSPYQEKLGRVSTVTLAPSSLTLRWLTANIRGASLSSLGPKVYDDSDSYMDQLQICFKVCFTVMYTNLQIRLMSLVLYGVNNAIPKLRDRSTIIVCAAIFRSVLQKQKGLISLILI